uniref:NADH dehydrogenase subunit 3 n=1 Tax=Setaria digitata TaxID=48799 RepID=D8WJD6_9BILA|nr:NADH dehydrogenase subunit 3 [Setaria digitata]ACZ44420.1 NADH dehydrogenase subunit 3 [Setaria digitata]
MFLNFFIVFLFSLFISFGMYLMVFFFSYKDFFYGKVSSYEGGFDVVKKPHWGFSWVFFSIVVMFMVLELKVIIFIIWVQPDFFIVFCLFFLFFFLYYCWFVYGMVLWKVGLIF